MTLTETEKKQLRIILGTCEIDLLYTWVEKRIERERKENFNTALDVAKVLVEVQQEKKDKNGK